MRVLVCGGRKFHDLMGLVRVMDRLHKELGRIDLIIHGAAPGADIRAGIWAQWRGIEIVKEPADWDDLSHPDAVIRRRYNGSKYDARAGIRRNQLMLDKHRPDLVAAFPGGDGTKDMVRKAEAAGIEVRRVRARDLRMGAPMGRSTHADKVLWDYEGGS